MPWALEMMGQEDLLVGSPGPSRAKYIRGGVKLGVNLSLCYEVPMQRARL